MASALGIAGSQAAGLYECHHDGTSTMIFHAGRAAQNGVEAALLTQAGFTGPATVLEGSKGFFQATADKFDVVAAMADFGQRYEIDSTSFRPYFGCNSTIAASGATAMMVHELHIAPGQVDHVTVHCHPVVAQDNADGNPQTMLAARLSLPFNVALVLHHGDVWAGDLPDAELHNPRIRALLSKVKLIADPAMSRRGAEITVRTQNGRSETETLRDPRGSEGNPLTWDEVATKFRSLVAATVDERDQCAVIDAVADLEALDGRRLAAVLLAAVTGTDMPARRLKSNG